jgi:hypothetical protein
MTSSKKDKKVEKSSKERKEDTGVKVTPKKESPKKAPPTKKMPSFVAKEALILNGKECIFVEKLKGKVVVRFEDGTYASANEESFLIK